MVDACWGADDGCLLSVSTDQTARITARLHDGQWCEIARPQVRARPPPTACELQPAACWEEAKYLWGWLSIGSWCTAEG